MNGNVFAARPAYPAYRPSFRPPVLGMSLGQGAPAASLGTNLVSLGVGAATTYFGVRGGLSEKGILSMLGWIAGIVGGISSLVMATEIAKEILPKTGYLTQQDLEMIERMQKTPPVPQ